MDQELIKLVDHQIGQTLSRIAAKVANAHESAKSAKELTDKAEAELIEISRELEALYVLLKC